MIGDGGVIQAVALNDKRYLRMQITYAAGVAVGTGLA